MIEFCYNCGHSAMLHAGGASGPCMTMGDCDCRSFVGSPAKIIRDDQRAHKHCWHGDKGTYCCHCEAQEPKACQCSVGCDELQAGEGAPEPTLCHQCNGEGCDPKAQEVEVEICQCGHAKDAHYLGEHGLDDCAKCSCYSYVERDSNWLMQSRCDVDGHEWDQDSGWIGHRTCRKCQAKQTLDGPPTCPDEFCQCGHKQRDHHMLDHDCLWGGCNCEGFEAQESTGTVAKDTIANARGKRSDTDPRHMPSDDPSLLLKHVYATDTWPEHELHASVPATPETLLHAQQTLPHAPDAHSPSPTHARRTQGPQPHVHSKATETDPKAMPEASGTWPLEW